MPMHNLIEYSDYYSDISGSLRQFEDSHRSGWTCHTHSTMIKLDTVIP